MKLLIAYASKNGVAKRCAEMLVSELCDKVDYDLVDICKHTPKLEKYDAVVLGGSIRMGRFNKSLRAFLKNNKKELSALPCAVFICCGLPHLYEEYSEVALPRKFAPSLGGHHFGGELKPDKVSGFDKLVVKHLRNSINQVDFEDNNNAEIYLPEIIPENIKLLATSLRKLK